MTNPADLLPRLAQQLNEGDAAAAEALIATSFPGAPPAQGKHLIGTAWCSIGRFEQAIPVLREAARLAPGHPGILMTLMRALIDNGQPEEALAFPFQTQNPAALLALWRTRAEAAFKAGDAPEEAAALVRVTELDLGDHGGRERLAALLVGLDRADDALAHVDQLPTSRSVLRIRANALAQLDRTNEAKAIDRAALADDADDKEAWLALVLLADRTADDATLSAMIEHGDRQGYAPSEVDYARALLAKREGRLDDALSLAEGSETPFDQSRRFALIATLADRLGDADRAFAAARSRAAAIPGADHWRRRAAAHRERLREAIDALDTIAPAARASAPERASPAFLVGFPRSGTTLLDTFLMGHPDVAVVEEKGMLEAAAMELGAPQAADEQAVARARAAYFEELDRHVAAEHRGRLIIDKLPLAMTGAATINRLFPDAPIIFAQRHPADSLVSNMLQAFRLNDAMANFLDLEDAAEFYDLSLRLWFKSKEVLKLDTFDIVYERLIDDPEASIRPLVDWLGLTWKPAMMDHRSTAKSRGLIATPSYDQVTQPLHNRAAGRWRRYAHQLSPVNATLDKWAQTLGYGPMTE